MAILDEIINRTAAPELAKKERESKTTYFDAMGKAAAHGYFDTYNQLLNGVSAKEAVKLVKEAASCVPGEIHKTAEGLLKENK